MRGINDFRELKVAKRIRMLCNQIYKLTIMFPQNEKYELGNQMRRAMDSVYLNLAEGNGQLYSKKKYNF